MRFGSPWIFWLLTLVPVLGGFFLWAVGRKRRALESFAGATLLPKLTHDVSWRRQYAKYVLATGGIFFLILALTGPRFGTRLAMAERRGVDVVVALDVSRSMRAQDVVPSRLQRAKYQIGELLDGLHGDRVALIIFAGQAFVQCPLTLDYGAVRMFMDIVGTDAISVQGTAIGDALDLAITSFDEEERQHRAVVLFTDGEDHLGDPLAAAERAAEAGVRVFAVGVGTPDGELIPGDVVGEAAGPGNSTAGAFHKDSRGHYVKTRLDEETLRRIALTTEGDYFRSSLSGGEIVAIAEQLAQMDQRQFGTTRFTQYEERYQIPLLLAVICFAMEAALADRRRSQGEWRGRFA